MRNNWIIRTKTTNNDCLYFAGWDSLGEISMRKNTPTYAYRMSKSVAINNLPKIEKYTRKECEIIPVL